MRLEASLARIPLSVPPVDAPGVTVLFSSADRWTGFRLERLRAPSGELAEGCLSGDLVALHLGGPQTLEVRWQGGPWTTHRFGRGAVHLVPARVPYSARWHAPAEWIALLLAPGSVAAAAGAPATLRAGFGLNEPLLAELLLALDEEARSPAPARGHAEKLCAAVAAQLARKHAAARPALFRRGLALARLRSVVEHIHEHLDAHLHLELLAQLASMNVHHFVRSFRRSTGFPPHQYVLRQRIERAKALLGEPEVPLAEVALRLGFSSQSSFTTAFRKLTGSTPGAYRVSLRD